MTTEPRTSAVAALVGAILALSLAGPLTKSSGLSPLAAVSARSLLGALVLGLASFRWSARAEPQTGAIDPTTPLPLFRIVVAAGLFVGFIGLWTASFDFISVGLSVMIVCCSSFATAALTGLRRRKWSSTQAMALLLAVGGIVPYALADVNSGPEVLTGVLLAGLGALVGGAYFTVLDHDSMRNHSPMRLWMWISAIAGTLALMCATPTAVLDELRHLGAGQVVAVVGLALVPHVIGQGLVLRIAAFGRPVLGSLAIVGETLGAALVAWLLLGERVPFAIIPAGLLFLCGVYILAGQQGDRVAAAR